MKTKLFILLLIFNLQFSIFNCFSQAGEWVWLKGDSIPNQPGNFGVQGVPSPTNNPPSLYEPCEWTDLNGNFWLFGGSYTSPGIYYNDLWKYDPMTNEWTWINGPGIANDAGNYGIQGVPATTNVPPARGFGVATWVDNQGMLWLFGGYGGGPLNDLWKYDISSNEWTWMKGADFSGQPGTYGTQGVADPANVPGARYETSASWADSAGNLWLFGGIGDFNDLWKYDITTNNWTWMKGSNFTGQTGIYGVMGVENSGNTPGARKPFARWKDDAGNFWLFGGGSYYNDLWRYNLTTNNWAWMGGDTVISAAGVYGVKCIADPGNIPGSRYESRAAWKDPSGNFWFFGGFGTGAMNDLWQYCLATGKWIWASGDNTVDPTGYWGTKGVSNPANKPCGRRGSNGWTDNNGHLYLFGGYGFSGVPYLNDLWKFTIDTTCGVCPATTSIDENSHSASTIEIFPNPSSESFTIRSADYAIDKIEIFNLLGEEVYEKQWSAAECQLLTRRFGNGIYIVKIYTHDRIYQKKLMVNH